MNLGDIATFPTKSDDWLVTVLIGGVLTFLGFLLLPLFVVWGYFVRVMRGGVQGETESPSFDDWGELLKDGVLAVVIMSVYQIVPMVVLVALATLSSGLMAVGGEGGAAAGFVGLLLSYGVYFVLFLAFLYVGAAGVVNYAREGSVGAAFDFGVIKPVVTSKEWAVSFLFYVGMMVAANVAGILIVTAPFASFYALAASSRAFGEAFAEATDTAAVTTGATAAEPA